MVELVLTERDAKQDCGIYRHNFIKGHEFKTFT